MSTKPLKRYGRRPALSILAAPGLTTLGLSALAGLGAAAAALADGVVVESSSSSHAVGERIEEGRFIAVEDGAEVTVLDRSGEVTRIAGPGESYDAQGAAEEESAAQRSDAAARLAVSLAGLGRRAGLGTARGGEAECEDTSGSRSAPSPACAAAAWTIALEADFAGHATCDVAASDGVWRRLDLGGAHGGVAIEAGEDLAISSEGGATLAGLEPGEDVSVRCQAVDAATWALLAPAWRGQYWAEEARALMAAFAAVSGGRFAEATQE
jgi:hypothetical protein